MTTGAIRRVKIQWNRHPNKPTPMQLCTDQMPFLSPNQQCQNTVYCYLYLNIAFSNTHTRRHLANVIEITIFKCALWHYISLTDTHYFVNVNVELKLIICRDISMILKLNYVFAASCSQPKTEADSGDITGHPHDDMTQSYLCTVCHKRFTTKSQLTNHSKGHTGENEYLCTQCEKRFSSQSGLWKHMNIHAGKYKCTECDKCCHSRRDLAVHRRIHSGEKPFECTVCSKRFTGA